ncbi:hypothetical protein RO3G_01809 [Rhizopus delemar RA 99-880]|uniref:Uncharacterized protein n=1 Tax=Rhizopus delemar (strain RA 99-880 / ATCC MYA-4621 / FGSC 9543 / NRRL 43880) TaxID=246409 RepID=I1BLM5_RHIO9|nr:hypothetical protein RO3G_01809 [Rhizopus delemar RA 99-880]|eukprot:EIE77105.1 hypothetical protein RO3G_01809 [Rhizopus delemar RA 99-880]
MDIGTETYPVDYITNYDEHLDCKPSEKTKSKPHNEKRSLHEKLNKMKIKFIHTGNMVMLLKNNYSSWFTKKP